MPPSAMMRHEYFPKNYEKLEKHTIERYRSFAAFLRKSSTSPINKRALDVMPPASATMRHEYFPNSYERLENHT